MGQNSVFRKDGIYFTRVNLIPALINCLKQKESLCWHRKCWSFLSLVFWSKGLWLAVDKRTVGKSGLRNIRDFWLSGITYSSQVRPRIFIIEDIKVLHILYYIDSTIFIRYNIKIYSFPPNKATWLATYFSHCSYIYNDYLS